jgi:hypothetical protein
MDRNDLERLDRDTLIARAEASGVVRARILTRPELIDELLQRDGATRPSEVARVRGFFGRARDLLARVVERGLHLPDAADRLRGRSVPPVPHAEAPLPTVTLAEIYAAQGHRERAVDTLRDVLAREPEHAAARRLYEKITDVAYVGPKPAPLPPEDEPAAGSAAPKEPPAETVLPATLRNAGDDPPRERAHDDECVAIPVDRESLFVHWDVSERTRKHLESARPGGALVLRVLVIAPTWEGPESTVRDAEMRAARGEAIVRGLPHRAVLRAAIGWRVGGELVPIAHSPALEAFESDVAGAVSSVVRWTTRGVVPVRAQDRDAASIERAFGAIRAQSQAAEMAGSGL